VGGDPRKLENRDLLVRVEVELAPRNVGEAGGLVARSCQPLVHGQDSRVAVTGVLLVGGASRRFGAPKALARLDGETLAERAWRVLGEACDERIAVGKTADGLPLPFPVADDGVAVRAPLAGVVAGLRAAGTDVCVFLPVDCTSITADALRVLADGCVDAAVPQTGPLPGAYAKRALPVLERRLADGELALRDAVEELDALVIHLDPALLTNVNRPEDVPAYTTARVEIVRVPGGEDEDRVAVEEPLEIRVNGEPIAVTMRTPGHDEELALGFLLSEGIVPSTAGVPDDLAANTIDVAVAGFDPERVRRNFYTSSSCGVCGKGALEAVSVEAPPVESDLRVPTQLVSALPDRLRAAQAAFTATGGLHATGLFTRDGELLCLREDVGRHNAMDKVIGWAFREQRLPLSDMLLCVSGRLSFELVQKAAVAGCPVLVAVGAPSSLAVDLARDRGITLCGFVREGRFNVYSGHERISD
jgi:FdhD protein